MAATSTPEQRPLCCSLPSVVGLKSAPWRRMERAVLSAAATNASSSVAELTVTSGAVACVSMLWQPTGPVLWRMV